MKPDNVICFDPGETTGYARLKMDAILMEWGQMNIDEMMDFCNQFDPEGVKYIVVEDFRLYRKKAKEQIGSTFLTVQVIGMLKAVARKHGIPLVMQDPAIKVIAEKFSGITPTGAHYRSHKVDAMNHGYYYLVRNHRAKTKMEREATRIPPSLTQP